MLTRKTQVAAKIEETKGSAEVLAETDANLLVVEPKFDYSPEEINREILRSTLGTEASIPGAPIATCTFRVELKGSGTPGTAPVFGRLLQACGFLEDLNTDSVIYTPSSNEADWKTLTIGYNLDGKFQFLYGAGGNVSFTWTSGQICYAEFNFSGIFDSETDKALWDEQSITFETTLPDKFYNAQAVLDFGSQWSDPVFSTVTLDMGNEVKVRENANAPNGLQYARIGQRNPRGTINVDQVAVATQDLTAFMTAPTLGIFEFTLGATPGNIISIAAPKIQIISKPTGDRDGTATHDLAFACRKNLGDDDVTITCS